MPYSPVRPKIKFDIPISPIAVEKKRKNRKIKREKKAKLEHEYHGLSYIDVMFKEIEEDSKKIGKKQSVPAKRKLNLSSNKSVQDISFGNSKKPKRTSKVVDMTPEEIKEIEEFELKIEIVKKSQSLEINDT